MQKTSTIPARSLPDEDDYLHRTGGSSARTDPHLVAAQSPPAGDGQRLSRILVVEDSLTQAHQLRCILAAAGYEVELAPDGERGFELLSASAFDLIISDIVMPGLSGYELCRKIKDDPAHATIPVMLLTSLTDPLDIVQGLEAGADNFLTKPYQRDALLGRVKTILDNNALRGDRKLKMSAEVVFLGKRLIINSDKEQILDLLISTFEDVVRTNRELQENKTELATAKRQVEEHARQLEGQVRSTEDKRNRAEEALVESERRFRRLVEFSPDAIFISRANKLAFANQPCLKLFGASAAEQVLGKNVFEFIHVDHHAASRERIRLMEMGKPVPLIETKIVRLNGTTVDVEASSSPFVEGGVTAVQVVCRDISDRKKLEEQYRQAQKMEAIGQLAGGVAHDFNNLLTIISGYSEMLVSCLHADDPTRGLVEEIHKAGDRAAHLTRQLLTFSRKAVVEPRVLDLNAVVTDTEKMLQRLIGEDIHLTTVLSPVLGSVKADAGQVEQVIMNLAVNARDAMPRGGRLTIETANVDLDESYTRLHTEVKPGRHVLLAVSDTGCGMSEETKARIFEPFFTTKGLGQGTGLGLATVYGIVKQSGGHVGVYSEPGRGATFKVYLPLVEERMTPGRALHGLKAAPRGHETILLVEDEDAVRGITRLAVQMHGYKVLEASNGDEAIRVCEQYKGPIHLLITDVVMPGMGGRQVADRLMACRPGINVLYLSGYTDDAVVRHGILQAEVAFLQKPFSPLALAHKVRELLDG